MVEVAIILRYAFGSISIDLISHSEYFRKALDVKHEIMFLHMNCARLRAFMEEHCAKNNQFQGQVLEIERKFREIKPDFELINGIGLGSEGEFIFRDVPKTANNFRREG